MGCAESSHAVSPQQAERERAIERMLKEDRMKIEKEVKILLLGAGQSGKSTLAKQMKILYLTGFPDDERAAYREILASNIFDSIRELLYGLQLAGLFLEPRNQVCFSHLFNFIFICRYFWTYNPCQGILHRSWLADKYLMQITPEVAADVKALWSDPAIQSVFHQHITNAEDSAPYFFENIDRYVAVNCIPTTEDVLRVRVKTTGILEIFFQIADVNFRMVDVGGQRSERRKWIHCFQDLSAVIFFVAMSEYNQYLIENPSVNRMHESITLFDEVVNSRWFEQTSIIIFLNKSDLFREKIQKVDMKILFDDYTGSLFVNFFLSKFKCDFPIF
jgi:guanine nucleotide-binding protein G(i) subunit alpha